MQVSVIIPALNEATDLPLLLNDLRPVRQAGNEVLLVDGGSTDDTVAVAVGGVDRVLASDPGRAHQMNVGAASASADTLWFLHADTRLPDSALDALLAVRSTGRRWGRFNVRLSGRDWRLRMIETLMNLRSCLTGIATGDQGLFIERALFEEAGRFPEIPLMEDVALSKRLRATSRPACIRTPRLQTSSRRWETRGVWATIVLMWRLRLAYAMGTSPADLARRYR
ncbi:MAG: TIGR04283 family arsenosugar biosynthesis glycosyltransferase [Chromatiaceae bacterium]|jgi:rSAM/selenodomain-associated transferase 2